jgi:hypothetical protein
MSDGEFDPAAYYTEDTVNAARAAGVIVYVVGYPRTKVMSPGMEALRRLSVQAGGKLVLAESTPPFALPSAFAAAPYAELDSGGQVSIDLEPALRASLTGSKELVLHLALSQTTVALSLPITLKHAGIEPSANDTAAPLPVVPQRLSPRSVDYSLWAWVAAAVVGSVATVWFFRRRRQPAIRRGRAPLPSPKAYFVRTDQPAARYLISKTPWRIGRGDDNELILNDNSVSRYHAEIVRGRDNVFTIRDLDSLNGVFVNDKKIQTAVLSEGGRIDVGDVGFTFTMPAGSDPAEAETTILRNS